MYGILSTLDNDFSGANMNVICPTGRTPFGAAAQLGNVEILQIFLDHCKGTNRVKVKSSTELKQSFDNSIEKNKTVKQKKPNLGYFVCVHNESSALNCSVAQDNVNLSNDVQMKNCDLCYDKCLPNAKSGEDCDILMSRINKTAYDLATFNDSFVRKDPRFKSKSWLNDLELSWEDGEITPDGMDKLEWDMEVEESNSLISSEVEDSWCALYFWYTGILLQTSSFLEEKPPPTDIDREDQFGYRALHYATVEGHIDAVKLLINAGND